MRLLAPISEYKIGVKAMSRKSVCRNCHFLAKEYRDRAGAVTSFSLNEKERNLVQNDAENVINEQYSLKCWMGVWDEGLSGTIRPKDINFTCRKNKCFFLTYNPGMLFPAAKEMQKRQAENNNIKRSHRLTQIGLFIAAFGLIVNAIISLFK